MKTARPRARSTAVAAWLCLLWLPITFLGCREQRPPAPQPVQAPADAEEDWPTRLHDVHRSGITTEQLSLPLEHAWTYATKRGPAPAWTESPAIHDYLHNWYDLKPRQAFDRCFDVAVVAPRLYFGSSTSGAVTCLDIQTGEEVWNYFTDGPVRFAPHVAGNRLYVGSDDGYVYCLDADHGSMIWRERAGPGDLRIWGNQHLISMWPVRTSVLVDGDDVFWTAGIFPEEGMFLCKRNAADGAGGWTKPAAAPPQGYLLALPDRVFVPTGKSFPRIYSRQTGECVGDIKDSARDGGCWALIAPGLDEIWYGPTTANATQGFATAGLARIASVAGANALVVDATHAYHCTDTHLVKTDRRSREIVWSKAQPYPHALVKAGDNLFAAGDGQVAAFDTDGQRVWTASVDGKAYGLAVARGRLFVSTDTGSIYCFQATLPHFRDDASVANVTSGTAELLATLAAHGADAANVTVFWGQSDGGTDAPSWAHSLELGTAPLGALAARVTGLAAERTYCFRFRARNSAGDAWSPSPGTFITGAVSVRAAHPTTSEQSDRPAIFTISRPAAAAAEPLTVAYTLSGTATPREDYQPLPGTVIIPEGESDVAIHLDPMDDLPLDEPDETVALTVEPGPYVVDATCTAAVTIQDTQRLADWTHRMRITFTGCDAAEALLDFPALVVLDDTIEGFDYGQFAAPDNAADLRFTDAAGTRFLSYEIEHWDPTGSSYLWLRIPELHGPDTAVYAHWGNPDAAQPPSYTADGTTWADGYAGVWHLGQPDGPLADSTQNGNHGRPEGGVTQGAAGVITNAITLSGDAAYVTLSSPLPIGDTGNTVSAWVKAPTVGAGGLAETERVGIVLGNFKDTPNSNWELHANGQMRTFWNNGEIDQPGAADLRDGQWHFLAWTRDKTAGKSFMYIDGALEKTIDAVGADITFATTHRIGGDNRPGSSPCLHGSVDEVRVVNVARSPDWLRTCYTNQSRPTAFVTYGPVEKPPEPSGGSIF